MSTIEAAKNTSNSEDILSTTMPNFQIKKGSTDLLARLTKFDGFYNKKFNLTSYSKMREESRSRSKSPERIYLPTKLKGNGIPNDIIPRIEFIKEKVKSAHFQDYFSECPKKKNSNLEETVDYICKYKGKHGELDLYLMIIYYISQTIKYDMNGYEGKRNNKYDQSPENIYKTGNALSIGFCNYFEYFCKRKNLKYRRIEGNSRLLPPLKDQSKTIYNHFWESIFVRGEWYFVDPLFAAGGPIDLPFEVSKSEKDYFNPFYFLTFPEYLIMTNRPKEDIWQKTNKIITEKQFLKKKLLNFGNFYHSYYEYDIQLLSHTFPFIKTTKGKELEIKIKVHDSVIQSDLYHANGKDKIGDVKYQYDDDNNIYSVEPIFPTKGDFVLIILARSNNSTDLLYGPFLEYKIRVTDDEMFHRFDKYKIGNIQKNRPQTEGSLILPKIVKGRINFQTKIIPDYNKIFPSKTNKKICYDNDNAYVIEPRVTFLKKGMEFKFKVRVKGASSVVVLDGRKFNYLKRIDGETYEGQFTIQTDNVCICSLRSSNVFTEIYRFKVNKDNTSRSLIKSKK